jgi:hypothetical protein
VRDLRFGQRLGNADRHVTGSSSSPGPRAVSCAGARLLRLGGSRSRRQSVHSSRTPGSFGPAGHPERLG